MYGSMILRGRERLNLTRKELASIVKRTPETIRRLEHEKIIPDNELLVSLVAELGLNEYAFCQDIIKQRERRKVSVLEHSALVNTIAKVRNRKLIMELMEIVSTFTTIEDRKGLESAITIAVEEMSCYSFSKKILKNVTEQTICGSPKRSNM